MSLKYEPSSEPLHISAVGLGLQGGGCSNWGLGVEVLLLQGLHGREYKYLAEM